MTYIASRNGAWNQHLQSATIQSANMMPPMVNSQRLDHLADCQDCYAKVNADVQKRVQDYAANRTKEMLTETKHLMTPTCV